MHQEPSSLASIAHLSQAQLEAGLDFIRQSPRDQGVVEMIVRRPRTNAREVLGECELSPSHGLVGDTWGVNHAHLSLAAPERATQLTLMNARAIALIAQHAERWPLAGDQIFLDLDLSGANLPPGTQLKIGHAMIEISAEPHTGCRKFVSRYGLDAMKFVNSDIGRALNLRGVNATIIQGGLVRVGDVATKTLRP